MTPRQKEAFDLRLEGKTYKEIGKIMGCSQQNAIRLTKEAAKKSGDKFMFRKNRTLSWRGNGGV